MSAYGRCAYARSTAHVLARLRDRPARDPLDVLTDQERRVLDLIGEGLTNRQIGERLFLAEKTVKGMEANEEQCEYWLERSAALATALAPQIGYARAAELSKQSVKENVLIRDLVKREKVLPAKEIDEVLDLKKMTEIGVPGGKHGGVSAG